MMKENKEVESASFRTGDREVLSEHEKLKAGRSPSGETGKIGRHF